MTVKVRNNWEENEQSCEVVKVCEVKKFKIIIICSALNVIMWDNVLLFVKIGTPCRKNDICEEHLVNIKLNIISKKLK